MLRLRYEQTESTGLAFRSDAGFVGLSLPRIRIRCQLRFPNAPNLPPVSCLVDTGANLTVIPEPIWSQFPTAASEKLTPLNEKARKGCTIVGVTGVVERADLRFVEVILIDIDGFESPRLRILAKCPGPRAKPGVRFSLRSLILRRRARMATAAVGSTSNENRVLIGMETLNQFKQFNVNFSNRSALLI